MNSERVKTTVVTGGLALWLTATAARQLPDFRFDVLLQWGTWRVPTPNWRFFGPNPGTKDSHLLYRDIGEAGPGEWEEVPVVEDRPWYGLAWNARNRCPKALIDALQGIKLAAHAQRGEAGVDGLARNPAYRFLEQYVTRHLPHEPGAAATQFLLMESFPGAGDRMEFDPVFASGELPLGRAAAR